MPPDRANAEDHYYNGLDRLAENRAEAAAAEFRQSLTADPSFLDARHGLVRALQDCRRYDDALAEAQALATLAPDDTLAYTALSILYQHKGMIAEAEEAGTKAKLLGWKQHLQASAGNA